MTGLVASGAMVSTYLSVFVTVLMAHTEITEIGIRRDASTRSTHAEMRRGMCPRRALAPLTVPDFTGISAAASGPASTPFASSACIWGSVSLIWTFPLALPTAKWTGAHAFLGVRLVV